MQQDSEILGKLSDLEGEVTRLINRLDPILVSPAPTQETAQPEAPRSQVNTRLKMLIAQVRDIQARIEL